MPTGVFNARNARNSDAVKPNWEELAGFKIQASKTHQEAAANILLSLSSLPERRILARAFDAKGHKPEMRSTRHM
jgi:hypothetical protein